MAINIENLSLKDFLNSIKKLSEFTVSAQGDGDLFFFGLDADGQFYSSQYSPNNPTKFCYSTSDYPKEADCNLPRAAHEFLHKKVKKLNSILQPGQALKAQLISSSATTTGLSKPNYISVLSGIKGELSLIDSSLISELVDTLAGELKIRVKQLDTVDGSQVFFKPAESIWNIRFTKRMSGHHLSTSELESKIKKLEKFLELPNTELADLSLTNYDVATINLIKIDTSNRSRVKEEREKLNQRILTKFKLPIKNELLATLEQELNTKSALLHNKTVEITLADDTEFTDVARFNSIAKRQISGFQRTDDDDASVEDRGGIMGILEQRIANLLGVPELSKTQSAIKFFKDVKGSTPKETAIVFSQSLTELNFNSIKGKVIAILKYGQRQLADQLEDFKQNASTVKMVTSDNKTITYTAEVIKQNLLEFAELKSKLSTLQSDISKSTDFSELVFALYEPAINAVFHKSISESILVEAPEDLSKLSSLTVEDICNAYCASLLASQLLLRAQDKLAAKCLRDTAHQNLTSYSKSMSPLNFWGFVLFNPTSKILKPFLSAAVISKLKQISGRFILSRIKKLHQSLSCNNNLQQDWGAQHENANLLTLRLNTRSQTINMAIVGIKYWDDITLTDKNLIIAKIFFYLQHCTPNSFLLTRIRALSNNTLIMANTNNVFKKEPLSTISENLMLDLNALVEDEMSATTLANSVSNTGSFAASDLGDARAPDSDGSATKYTANRSLKNTTRLVNGKYVILRDRDFKKKKKFAAPTPVTNIDNIAEDDGGAASDVAATTTSSAAIATVPVRLFGNKKKKKKMIKRIVPGYLFPTSVDSDDVSEQVHVTLEWTDIDFSGNALTDAGFAELNSKGIKTEIVNLLEESGWPTVKISGNISIIKKFLKDEYGASDQFINSNIREK